MMSQAGTSGVQQLKTPTSRVLATASAAAAGVAMMGHAFGPLVAGGLTGLVAAISWRRPGSAAVAGATALTIWVLIAFISPPQLAAIFPALSPGTALLAVAIAAVTGTAVGHMKRSPQAHAWASATALIVAILGMWAGGLTGAATSGPGHLSMNEWLRSTPDLARHRDDDLYLAVFQRMRADRLGYYDAVLHTLAESHPDRPVDLSSAIRFRQPALFWLWALLPLSAPAVFVGGFLAFSTLGVIAAYVLGLTLAGPARAAAGAALVAAYSIGVVASPFLTFSEPWVAALLLVAVAAWTLHMMRPGDTRLLILAVAAALAAALMREIAVFVIVAGLVSALYADRADSRRRWMLWLGALLLFIAAYTGHALSLRAGLLGHGPLGYTFDLGRILPADRTGDYFLPGSALFSVTGMVLALLGIARMKVRPVKVFAMLALALPFVAFALVGPAGWVPEGSTSAPAHLTYWELMVKPALWAFLPAASLSVPALARALKPAVP